VHGCIRDSDEIRVLPLGVKALQAVPRRSAGTGAGDQGVPVTFAGVTFTRGCHLYADRDGIVVAERDLLAS
jgi:regulator of ribonuclease activity A